MTSPIYYDDGTTQISFLDAINQGLIQNTYSLEKSDPNADTFINILTQGMSDTDGTSPMSTATAQKLWAGFLSSYSKIGYQFQGLGDMANRWNTFVSSYNISGNSNKANENLWAAYFSYFATSIGAVINGNTVSGDWSIVTTSTDGSDYTPFNIFSPAVDNFINTSDWGALKAAFSANGSADLSTTPPISSSVGTSAMLQLNGTNAISSVSSADVQDGIGYLNNWQDFLTVVSTVGTGDVTFPSSGLSSSTSVINAYQNIFESFGGNPDDFVATLKQFITNEKNTYGYFLPSQSFGRWIEQVRTDNPAIMDPGGASKTATDIQTVLNQIQANSNVISNQVNNLNGAVSIYNQISQDLAAQNTTLNNAYSAFINTITSIGGYYDSTEQAYIIPDTQGAVDAYNAAASNYNTYVNNFNNYVTTTIYPKISAYNTAVNAYSSGSSSAISAMTSLLSTYGISTSGKLPSPTPTTLSTDNFSAVSTNLPNQIFVPDFEGPGLIVTVFGPPSWIYGSTSIPSFSYSTPLTSSVVNTITQKITYQNSLDPVSGSSLSGNNSEKVLIMNRILKLLIALIGALQQIGVSQATHLNFTTKFEQAYTALQQQIPTFVAGGPYKIGQADQDGLNARNEINSTVNGALTDNLRNLRSLQEDSAKQQQSYINQTNDAVNQQTDICTSFLQQLNSLLGSIFR